MAKLVALAIGLLPASWLKSRALSRLRGFRVDPTAEIRPVVLWGVRSVHIGAGARIGPGSIFRSLSELSVGDHAEIGQLNWISNGSGQPVPGGGFLRLEAESALTSRHYIDCTGGITVGERTTIGGVRSTMLTHWVDTATSVRRTSGIEIGAACLIHSNVLITPGRKIADRCVVAAGAVVSADLTLSEMLYGGVPARPLRSRDGDHYFERIRGRIDGEGLRT